MVNRQVEFETFNLQLENMRRHKLGRTYEDWVFTCYTNLLVNLKAYTQQVHIRRKKSRLKHGICTPLPSIIVT